MLKQVLTEYYNDQKVKLEENLRKIDNRDNVEVIHQIRLSVKKIRALYSFIWHLSPEKKTGKKSLKIIQRLYKPAGVMRDIQVHLELVRNYEKRYAINFEDYTTFYQNREKEKNAELIQLAREFAMEPLDELNLKLKKILDNSNEEELKSKATGLLEDKMEIIRNLNKLPTNKDKNLHNIRRYLKEIWYLLGIFDSYIPESGAIKVSLLRLKQIEQTLGKWHDQVNALNFLEIYNNEKETKDKTVQAKFNMLNKAISRYKGLLYKRTKLAFKYELDLE